MTAPHPASPRPAHPTDPASPPASPRPASAGAAVVLIAAFVAGPWAAALLFVLAGFGATPPATLPWSVVALIGALLAAPAAQAATLLPPRRALGLTAAGVALAVASALAAALPLAYLAALPVALATFALLRRVPELYGTALVYVGATVLANFTLDSFLPLGDFFLVNVGTLFFGITFTQRDRLHRFGRGVVYRVILAAALANVVAAWSVGTPWRYVAVSFLAIVIAETADTEVYQRLLHLRWFARVAGSNAVSAPLDTVVFTVLAFAGAPFATAAWMTQVIVTDVFVKYGASLIAAITVLSNPAWVPKAPDLRARDASGTQTLDPARQR